MPLLGAIVVCQGEGEEGVDVGVTASFGGVDVVQGAIVVCYGWGNFGGVDVVPPTLGEWTWCL